jgi:hypothetical protein
VTAPPDYAPPHRLRDAFSGPQVRVGLLAAAALIAEALLAKIVGANCNALLIGSTTNRCRCASIRTARSRSSGEHSRLLPAWSFRPGCAEPDAYFAEAAIGEWPDAVLVSETG